ncbi:MAG: glycosyltransferase [Anaerolineae bacterium]|nr:glycosyltransferase [Anaerolineae bacterium]
MIAPLVSILIPAYNQAQFLTETLSSALEQDYDSLEVIIADDGSRDESAAVIADFARRYPERLVPILGETNVGVTKNYNRGLRHCRGKYVALQGGDDVLLPGKIAAQVAWMEADPRRALCGHDVEVFDSASGQTLYRWTERIAMRQGQSGYDAVRFGHLMPGTSTMMRACYLPTTGCDERIPIASDWKLWVDLLTNAGENGHFGWIDGVWARYRVWGGQVTKRKLSFQKDLSKTAQLLMTESADPRIRRFYRIERAKRQFERGYYFLRKGDIGRARHLLSASLHSEIYAPKPVLAYLAAWLPAGAIGRLLKAYRGGQPH